MRTQPKLGKESSSALIDLGQAISGNATSEETTLLIDSTLVQEAYARNASLQALKVILWPVLCHHQCNFFWNQPFDLTEFDWSPELLIACHDSDEPNARLARHIWEDNGLDVEEVYAPALLKLLGKSLGTFFALSVLMGQFVEHDNAYVRSGAADAFVEAAERWPASITETIHTILQLYHEKVVYRTS
jgi:hypothetical protein